MPSTKPMIEKQMTRYMTVMTEAEKLFKFTKETSVDSIKQYQKAIETFFDAMTLAREVKIWSLWSSVISLAAGILFLVGVLLTR